MKQTDKKIICIFLIIIILVSQFSTIIFAEDDNANSITLEEYLIENGVDKNGDGNISDEEWKSVKNLDLSRRYNDYGKYVNVGEFTGIEKAINLKKLELENAELSLINFEKLKNLKNLYVKNSNISSTNFEKLENLEILNIENSDLTGIDLRKLKKLKHLSLSNCSFENLEISELDELNSLSIGYVNLNNFKIENLKNLESVSFYGCDTSNFDFSKIKNIKELSINFNSSEMLKKIDLDLTAFENLEILDIDDKMPYSYDLEKYEYVHKDVSVINSLNISGLSKLKILELVETYDCDIKISELNNIEKIRIDNNKIDEIDFTQYEKLNNITVSKEKNLTKEDIKINKEFVAIEEYKIMCCSQVTLEQKEDTIQMVKGGMFYVWDEWRDCSLEPIESDVLEIDGSKIIAKDVGEQKIKVIDVLDREIEILVKVVEQNINMELDDFGITAKEIEDNRILKSNGELWRINSETTAEIIDTNVKKYISEGIYSDGFGYTRVFNTLYNDNKLSVKFYNNVEKQIDNVKDIGDWFYVTTDGKLYEYRLNYITEELDINYIMDNVKKVFEGKYIVLENGKTLDRSYNEKFDFEIKECKSTIIWDEAYYGGMEVELITDTNDNEWIYYTRYSLGLQKRDENKEIRECIYGSYLSLSQNKTAHITGWKKNEDEILKAPLVLTDVEDINAVGDIIGYKMILIDTDTLIRKDGSIWLYNPKNGLTKITESTPSTDDEFSEIPEESLITNPEINVKDIYDKDCLTGLKLNENDTLTVNEFVSQNNINEEFVVRVFDSEDKELKDDSLMGTGTKVKLYDGDYLVKEYIIIIYGDTDGDAQITAKDALTLIKILNEKIEPESQAHVEAGKLSGESELTPADALRIIKHLNKKYEITQDI